MNCQNHPEAAAAQACASCQHPFCASCLTSLMGYPVCGRCKEYRMAQMQTGPAHRAPSGPPTLADHIIPAKNPLALSAYYCGVFALIPGVGNLLGPAAIVLGVLGLRAQRENPNLPGKGHAIAGIVLGSLTSLVYWGLVLALVATAFGSR